MELISKVLSAWAFEIFYAEVVSCCVYGMQKQWRQCAKDNNQICLTNGQIRALISHYMLRSLSSV